ncbi:Putative 1-phosphatidylinositol-3-phosphate 5-kinase FAB1C [Striga hermonthica]|uniref:1-phosphatidylinositol-3-phosphate 5-kinase n=1 Tax=Striga hermonthica TaxID=68872 RepID=A0A9N7RCT9_STRHE|nr:Putative 1-phosphatidylinositol-3-phosphate 5-kinase FAB1C [Striga hermonthica]
MQDSLLLHLIHKVRSWIFLGNSDIDYILGGFETTMDSNSSICWICKRGVQKFDLKYHCQSCGSMSCENCVGQEHVNEEFGSVFRMKSCKLCRDLSRLSKSDRKCSGKVYPSESPRQSPELPSPTFSGERFDVHSSPMSAHCSTSRIDEDDKEYLHDISDLDSSSVTGSRHEFYNPMSSGSSPSDSPSRLHISPSRVGQSLQVDQGGPPQPLDFETNGPIWFPPQPDDCCDKIGNKLFIYDDDDEDDDVGEGGFVYSPTTNIDTVFSDKEKREFDHKGKWRGVVEGHFTALVSQLLQGQGIVGEDWVGIVTAISWQAAKFIKPNTSRGGSMDPCEYLKVKCVASGSRGESKLIKGVVCTKNIKHKRMTSQYKNARLLILGGSLEYQRVPNQLASFETLLQQENDHLKNIVSKIEAHRPNVLLVEKSVSSFALEHLLAKEISLVLNVKRPLLERIARCSGASITPSIEHLSTTRLGHCELFRLEKVPEVHEPMNQFNKKPSKTLMFFEGCPRRLGCTVVLRGSFREELKKVKHVVQYAVFAAYHLSLETSFLADEGASVPKLHSKSLLFGPETTTTQDKDTSANTEEISSANANLLSADLNPQESLSELSHTNDYSISMPNELGYRETLSEAYDVDREARPSSLDTGINQKEDAECFSTNNAHPSILVAFSSHCMAKGSVCERSRLVRIKFYGPSDKPLGRYLRDDLFDQSNVCQSCKDPAEAHVMCYTHQNANLTINVKCLPSVKLPGEEDGKIWMWHRCLRCAYVDGVPPAAQRVVMSDAAWGLSFGKFLELSLTSHTTGNRVAGCGHSLQRDCLRFYGFGNMVAFFRYSPIDILSVRLPPSILEFCGPNEQGWVRNELDELLRKARAFHAEVSNFLEEFRVKSLSFVDEFSDANELHNHILELNNMLSEEKSCYEGLLQLAGETPQNHDQLAPIDILEMNRLKHSLLVGSRVWDRRLYLLDTLLKTSNPKLPIDLTTLSESKYCQGLSGLYLSVENNVPEPPKFNDDISITTTSLERSPSAASLLSDQIDSAWSGSADLVIAKKESPSVKRVMGPTRVYSFDSAQRLQERIQKGLPPSSLYLSNLRSFHASGDYRYMVRDPVNIAAVQRTYSQILPHKAEKLNIFSPYFILRVPALPEGVRLMPPSSIISYALSSREHEDWIQDRGRPGTESLRDLSTMGSLDLENSPDSSQNDSPHVRIFFEDERTRFSVTCYFARQFDSLRRKCCPSQVDFVQSLSRCRRWSAQGGKSNVYFAKSFDERFIIKQVTKTELESFEEFAPEYFKYLTDAIGSGGPTCLAKVLGIYQVTVKHLKGGKEVKMDVMVMENLFFGRNISKVYDLKGSSRSRYNPDTVGPNKVLLDTNLLETLRTNPIFLGSKAKRSLERAVWNDTSFLASVDVMDYSLLVGVDKDRKELVMGIIDFMRQYTWDKHLETWVKASGILGGPKNASPTIISPIQYKKRRVCMRVAQPCSRPSVRSRPFSRTAQPRELNPRPYEPDSARRPRIPSVRPSSSPDLAPAP